MILYNMQLERRPTGWIQAEVFGPDLVEKLFFFFFFSFFLFFFDASLGFYEEI